jgi:hypothetical protein
MAELGRKSVRGGKLKFIGFEREDEALLWAKQILGIQGETGLSRAMSAVDPEGEFCFVVVLSNFSARNIDMHTASSGSGEWATSRAAVVMFNAIFQYAFDHLGAVRVTGLVKSTNTDAIQFDEHLGFTHEGTLRQAYPDADLLLYGFLSTEFHEHKWYRKSI